MSQNDSQADNEFKQHQKRLIERLNDPQTREDAASELVDLYSREMYLRARSQLNASFSRRFDAEDVLQTVFRTFFRRAHQFSDATDRELRLILMAITVKKSISLARKHTLEGRDIRKEEWADPNFIINHTKLVPSQPLRVRVTNKSSDTPNSPMTNAPFKGVADLVDKIPASDAPDQALILRELILQTPKQLQPVLVLMYEGYTQNEIADLLKCARRSVARKKASLTLYFRSVLEEWAIPGSSEGESY
ncbi:MAG: RNA polymerase sigma factor [Mariniblastus sp.]